LNNTPIFLAACPKGRVENLNWRSKLGPSARAAENQTAIIVFAVID
jgi:hypothetical protein